MQDSFAALESYGRSPAVSIKDRLRDFVSKYIASVMFLGCYFLTVVLGNIIYATPFGPSLLTSANFSLDALHFSTTFSVGYWALLLLPFVAVPIGVHFMRPLAGRLVQPIVNLVPEFRKIDYTILLAVVYSIIAWTFWHTDIFGLSARATNALAAINARFALQSQMSFPEQIVINAILPFLSFYSIVAAIKGARRYWLAVAVFNFVATSIVLLAINMKWPILVFYIGIVCALFVFSRSRAYTKAIVGGIILVACYLAISSYVFRLVPAEHEAPGFSRDSVAVAGDYTGALVSHSLSNAPFLFAEAIDRMAIGFPYYYKVFTDEGPLCGTLIQQVLPGHKPCAPTYLIYTRIFGDDGFQGRGSSPEAPHITSYAFAGWTGALLAMLGTCIVLVAFSSIPLDAGAMGAAWIVVGATVGYHLSQLPGEGPVIYYHGFLWPLILVAAYSLIRRLLTVGGMIFRRGVAPR